MIPQKMPRHLLATFSIIPLLILMAGCAATPGAPSLFVLDSASSPTADHAPQPDAPTLMIKPVMTVAYLNQGGIVYQTGPHHVVIANDNRWASPLSDQLTDNLYAVLAQYLPDTNIVRAQGNKQGQYQLRTRVNQFLGRYDGKAHIAGRWTLMGPKDQTLASHAFIEDVPLKSDGYPALVSSLATGWQHVGHDMALALRNTLRSHAGS